MHVTCHADVDGRYGTLLVNEYSENSASQLNQFTSSAHFGGQPSTDPNRRQKFLWTQKAASFESSSRRPSFRDNAIYNTALSQRPLLKFTNKLPSFEETSASLRPACIYEQPIEQSDLFQSSLSTPSNNVEKCHGLVGQNTAPNRSVAVPQPFWRRQKLFQICSQRSSNIHPLEIPCSNKSLTCHCDANHALNDAPFSAPAEIFAYYQEDQSQQIFLWDSFNNEGSNIISNGKANRNQNASDNSKTDCINCQRRTLTRRQLVVNQINIGADVSDVTTFQFPTEVKSRRWDAISSENVPQIVESVDTLFLNNHLSTNTIYSEINESEACRSNLVCGGYNEDVIEFETTNPIVHSSDMKRNLVFKDEGKIASTSSFPSNQLSTSGLYECFQCKKTFGSKSALGKHRLIHSKDRKYVCPSCSKSFKRQDHLNGHVLTHLQKKPFSCKVPNCFKSYCDSRSLKRHIECKHQHTLADLLCGNESVREFLPPIDSIFVRISGSVHRISLPSKSTVSDVDREIFERMAGLLNGSNRDTNAVTFGFEEPKPVNCSLCRRSFKSMAALYGHMRLHGGYIRFQTQQANVIKTSELLSPSDIGFVTFGDDRYPTSPSESLASDGLVSFNPESLTGSSRPMSTYDECCILPHQVNLSKEEVNQLILPIEEDRISSLKPASITHISSMDELRNDDNLNFDPKIYQSHYQTSEKLFNPVQYRPSPMLKRTMNGNKYEIIEFTRKNNCSINIGSQYQADIPSIQAELVDSQNDEIVLWDPESFEKDDTYWHKVEEYTIFAQSSVIPCKYSIDSALMVLYRCHGDIFTAVNCLLSKNMNVQSSLEIRALHKSEQNLPFTNPWTTNEIRVFLKLFDRVHKNFDKIAAEEKPPQTVLNYITYGKIFRRLNDNFTVKRLESTDVHR